MGLIQQSKALTTTSFLKANPNLTRNFSSKRVSPGPVSWRSLTATFVISVAAVSYYQIKKDEQLSSSTGKVVSTGTPALGGKWALIDVNTGKVVTNKDFEDQYTLLYFGFANCPDICPSELQKVAQVMDELTTTNPTLAKKITPIFVSVDPDRDTMDKLKIYGGDFHPSIRYLTGTPEMIKATAKLYRVYISKADETEDGDYLLDHSIVLYFSGKDGNFLDFFTQSMKVRDMVSKIQAHAEANGDK